MLYAPLVNTLITGVISTVIALIVGGGLAWCVIRSDMPGKGWLQPVLTLPYIVPSFAIALAWETVFRSPKVGGQPGLYETVLGIPPPGMGFLWHVSDINYISDALLSIRLPSCGWRSSDY